MSQNPRRGTGTTDQVQDEWQDAFGRQVALRTVNRSDLASHYDYSPERYRVSVNGTRQFIQYDGAPAEFEDTVDSYTLKPQTDGDVVTLRTAERFRYVVQYVLEWSLAFSINTNLAAGDVWAVGYGHPDLENATGDEPGPSADGWLVYQNSSHATDEVTLAEYRDGTSVDTQEIELASLPQTWGRLAASTNWYNVGETTLEETYTVRPAEENLQQNDKLGSVGNPDGKGPTRGNFPVRASVKVGATNAGVLELDVGSIGVRILGGVQFITRAKTFSYSEPIETPNSTWQPVLAIRRDPDRDNVNIQFDALEVLEFTGSDDAFGLIQEFDADKVADTNGDPLQEGNWTTPPELSATNSVTEVNPNVDQVADSTGTLQASMANPGGIQLGFGSRYASGQGSSEQRSASAALNQRRSLSNGDVGVLLVKSPSTGTVKGQISTEQDW